MGENFKKILAQGVEQGVFPGGALLASYRGRKEIVEWAGSVSSLPEAAAVTRRRFSIWPL